MSEAPAETPGTPPEAPVTPPATTPPAEAPKTPEAPKVAEWDGKIESLPTAAQKVINDLRKADGDERVAKKTLDAIQKALNPDAKAGEKPDAEALTRSLTEQQAEAKQAKTELAVYKLAGKTGADADALLDSRSFLAKLKEIDPTDAKAITKAITDAVTENPKLKLARAAGASGSDFSGGSGEGALNQEKFNSMTPSEKNTLFKTNPTEYRKFSGR